MTESNEKMLQPELTLTLDPFSEPAPQMQTAQPEPPMAQEQPKPAFDESMLTEQERQMVNNFAAQIDLSNSSVRRRWRTFPKAHWKMCAPRIWAKSARC